MIDNELIEERLKKKARRRKRIVTAEIIIILLLFAAILYYLLAVRPAILAGHPEQAVPSFLKNVISIPEGSGNIDPEPTRLPTPTPSLTPTETPAPTPTPEPVPTLAPEIEALKLPSFDNCEPDDWNLILINQEHPIPEDYTVALDYTDEEESYSVDERIIEPLRQMLADCRSAGYSPEICSAFRSTDTQSYLYYEEETEGQPDGYWDPDTGEWISILPAGPAEEETEADADSEEEATAVAAPGTSEHEVGLAVDIYSSENTDLDVSQENTETQQWLMAHCYDYGFILRYPRDKSEITGIIYEPWHYRFVGTDAALDIRDSGLCLEEYLERMQIVKEAEAALE